MNRFNRGITMRCTKNCLNMKSGNYFCQFGNVKAHSAQYKSDRYLAVLNSSVLLGLQPSSLLFHGIKYHTHHNSRTSKASFSTVIDNSTCSIAYTQDYVDYFFNEDFINKNYTPDVVAEVMIKTGLAKSRISLVNHYSKILAYLEKSSEVMTSQNICHMIYGMGGNINSHSDEFYQIILLLSQKLYIATEECSTKDISKALFGLKHLTDEKVEVQCLIVALALKLQQCTQPFSSFEVLSSLFGMRNLKCTDPLSRQLLKSLIPKVESCVEVFDSQMVAITIAALFPHLESDTEEIYQLLGAFIPKIDSCTEPLSPRVVRSALYSLQYLNTDWEETRDHIRVLVPKIISCNFPLNIKMLARALFGLRNMKSDVLEVKSLLQALVLKIESSEDILNSDCVSNALYGLQSIGIDTDEVRQVLKVLIPKVESNTEIFNYQPIIDSFRSSNSNYEEVSRLLKILELKTFEFNKTIQLNVESNDFQERRLLNGGAVENNQSEVHSYFSKDITEYNKSSFVQMIKTAGQTNINLTDHFPKLLSYLETTTVVFTTKELCNMIYSLECCTSSMKSETFYQVLDVLAIKLSDEMSMNGSYSMHDLSMVLFGLRNLESERLNTVLKLLDALTIKIQCCQDVFDSCDIANSLFGLQFMSSEYLEVQQLLLALIPKIESCIDKFTSTEIGYALFGLQSMSTYYDEVRQLLRVLSPKIEAGAGTLDPLAISQSLKGLWKMKIIRSQDIRMLFIILIPKIESCTEPMNAFQIIESLSCLKSMKDSIEMRQLAKILINKIQLCTGFFPTGDDIIMKELFHRLKSSNNKCEELNQLFKAIDDKRLSRLNTLPSRKYISSKLK